MITNCEILVVSVILTGVFGGQYHIEKDDIESVKRTGDFSLFYLKIEFKKSIRIPMTRHGRFRVELLINNKFFPLNLLILSDRIIEIEKWDDREDLPRDCNIHEIKIEKLENF